MAEIPNLEKCARDVIQIALNTYIDDKKTTLGELLTLFRAGSLAPVTRCADCVHGALTSAEYVNCHGAPHPKEWYCADGIQKDLARMIWDAKNNPVTT